MLKLGALHLVIGPLLLVPIVFFLLLLAWPDRLITLEAFVTLVAVTYALGGVPAVFHGMLVGYITMKKKGYTISENIFSAVFSTFLFLMLIEIIRWLSLGLSASMEIDRGFTVVFIAVMTICLIIDASVIKLIFHFEYSEKRNA